MENPSNGDNNGFLWCFMVIYGDLMGFYGGNNGFL